MLKIPIFKRKNLSQIAKKYGFNFYKINNQPYWQENYYYQFTKKQIEQDLEHPSVELHQMCLNLIPKILKSEELFLRFEIDKKYWDLIANSWQTNKGFYGRFDFSYDGEKPAKLLEYNADTPTSIYESAFFQWLWLEDNVNLGNLANSSDQFNFIQEAIITYFAKLNTPKKTNFKLYFASCKNSKEDRSTVKYLQDCANQAKIKNKFIYIEDIGVNLSRNFCDLDNQEIFNLFKLYPWEWIFSDPFSKYLTQSKCNFLEPAWKILLSSKSILPILWQEYKNHPNLLPSYFLDNIRDDIGKSFYFKPNFSREGADILFGKNVKSWQKNKHHIIQKSHNLPNYKNMYPVVGSWIIDGVSCGIGIREDKSLITKDTSLFVPHVFS